MLKKLVKIANRLDDFGLTKEADVIDAVIQKMAQVEGVPGAKYQSGRQVSVTPGGPTVRFYASKPDSMQKLNGYLGNLVKSFAGLEMNGKEVFPAELTNNAPKSSDSSWTKGTEAAFDAFAEAAGYPEAGVNWVNFAKENKYAPSVDGIVAFVEDNLGRVNENMIRLRDTLARLSAPSKSAPSEAISPQEQLAAAQKLQQESERPTILKTPEISDKRDVARTITELPSLSSETSGASLEDFRIDSDALGRAQLQASFANQIMKDPTIPQAAKQVRLDSLGFKIVTENGVQKAVRK